MYFRNCDLETVGLDEAAKWIDPPKAPSNYKDPDKIAEYVRDATAKQLEMCGLDAHMCRIVAFGWEDIGHTNPTIALCSTEFEEREQLKQQWETWFDFQRKAHDEQRDLPPRDRVDPVYLTYNGNRFDLIVMMMRSMWLKVPHPKLNVDRYRSPHIDLYKVLTCNYTIDGHSLRFFAKRAGLPIYDDITGADVARMVKEGNWQAIHDHCLSDLALNRALAETIGEIPAIRTQVAA